MHLKTKYFPTLKINTPGDVERDSIIQMHNLTNLTCACTLAYLINIHPLINVREGQYIKINKSLILNKDVQEGQISKKNKRPGTL